MFTATTPVLSIYPGDDAIRIVTDSAGACGGCGGMAFIFINRNGRTRCVHCDLQPAIQNAAFNTDSPHAST